MRCPRTAVAVPIVLMSLACRGETEPTDLPHSETWTCTELDVLPECPEDAIVLTGEPIAVDVDLDWTLQCGAAVGPVLYVALPDELTAVHLTVDAGLTETGMELGLDGAPLVTRDAWGTLPQRLYRARASSALLPNGDGPPPTGCLAVLPLVFDLDADGGSARVWIHSRLGAVPDRGVLPIHLVRTDTDDVDARAAIGVASRILLEQAGIQLEIASVEAGPDEPLLEGPHDLLMTLDGPADAAPVVFVELLAGGALGEAGGVPASLAPGTPSHGVVLALERYRDHEGFDAQSAGEAVAHELGHYLGLFHTSEMGGGPHDPLADTPECRREHDANGDGALQDDECPGDVAGNLMFHTHLKDRRPLVLTPSQDAVLRRYPAILPNPEETR